MDDRPPFGFRQDREERKPEPEEDEQREISCTSLHEQKTWQPAPRMPVNGGDYGNRWYW